MTSDKWLVLSGCIWLPRYLEQESDLYANFSFYSALFIHVTIETKTANDIQSNGDDIRRILSSDWLTRAGNA